jgi:DNA polymerase III delta subunit
MTRTITHKDTELLIKDIIKTKHPGPPGLTVEFYQITKKNLNQYFSKYSKKLKLQINSMYEY